ncbi:hypothetical protein [Saccharicrinis aurantiacus]|uniref:hypothetical protein n=1 Tax=Saccharicrinis aurantiacus TaxID=1849719 RepID=UPI00249380BD|nr:hypothetical protein [Saccharicrinis aurantiacus]
MRLSLIMSFSVCIVSQGYSQINHSIKLDAGFLKYQYNTVQVDPGENWKGYYLNEENGVDFNIVNSLEYNHKLFVGIGLGYLNFEGINGVSIFSDFEYLPLKTRFSPLVNLKIGYSQIWNQYENGTGTVLVELCCGFNYRLTEKLDFFTKIGIAATQQSMLMPIRLGIRY